ncbi:MAG: protein phosphatase [Peptococcaceae bacterium]|nr:protein phosphatase [Peptococcaceae bacterium]
MEEMNMVELLVQQSQENMARKILEMMNESKDLEEAKKKVKDLLNN